jgi:hypothetical protein
MNLKKQMNKKPINLWDTLIDKVYSKIREDLYVKFNSQIILKIRKNIQPEFRIKIPLYDFKEILKKDLNIPEDDV